MKLAIAITHAAFDARRGRAMAALYDELEPQCRDAGVELYVHSDYEAKGSLQPGIRTLEGALRIDGVTHVTMLPDDAILVPHFVEVLLNVIRARPDAIICCQSNEARAAKLPPDPRGGWYVVRDGHTNFGGTMPADMWRAYLAWRRDALRTGPIVQFDEGVNLWAMRHGHLIHKPLPSLVDHDLSLPSLDGNDTGPNTQTPRRPVVFAADADLRALDWGGAVTDFGRTYLGNHWRLAFDVRPEHWDVDRMYQVERRGVPVSQTPHVLIATPAYTPMETAMRKSRDAVCADLVEHGIEVSLLETPGDSLVTRGRHVIMHEFLASTCTHMLQWDADLAVDNPAVVREMLATGHYVVGGAYPFRNGSGQVVANPRPQDVAGGSLESDDAGCIPVAAVGTGFLLTSRRAVVRLCEAHPELLYEADIEPYRGRPMWALFDVALVPYPGRESRQRYLSEDYQFCRLWRDLGEEVYVYYPPTFEHWGRMPARGHILKAWGMDSRPAEAAE